MTATLADVARRAGVSTATVSRVLNGNYPVAGATRERVLDALAELDYVVNGPARALAASSTDVIGVIVNDVSDPFFGIQAGGLQREVAEEDLLAVICNTAGSPSEELKYLSLLLRQRVRGIVLTGGAREDAEHEAATAKLIRQAQAVGTRVVLCGRPAPAGVEAPCVVFDNEAGATALTRHVVEMGHERIGYVAGPRGNTTTTARLAGHRAALREAGIRRAASPIVHGDFSRDSGFDAAMRLSRADGDVTAIIAANDLMALGVMAALRRAGTEVPRQCSVAGFDDLPSASDCAPALTTVRLPLESGARRAGRIATGRDGAEDGDAWLGAELLVRDSVVRPGGRARRAR
ncbi:LacI family transcriptional regulator [Herbihabitans rhizosphaerae]|uniref:LacI family transcriptional regulator n=1 Tax=Herbihabitans rhizosphaerae TaxID=1872711 RepID=A0A4Q7KF74_9PSEU|nr:LacI family DNA-binding transcriptional regulator [Herbihabitans rhizosphaerae]RZS30311.1 LacI family transcriptional regulator [Herbihabitans rhizosphaerae]